MGELLGACHVTGGVDIGVQRFQVGVGGDGALAGNAQFFQTQAGQPGLASQCAQQGFKAQVQRLPLVLHPQLRVAVGVTFALQRGVAGQHPHTVLLQRVLHQSAHVFVLAQQQARRLFQHGHLRAQSRQALRQLATNGAAAQHQQALRGRLKLAQVLPQRVAGQHVKALGLCVFQERRQQRARARGQHNGAAAQALHRRCALPGHGGGGNLHRPGVDEPGMALQHFHAQAGVARHAVVWRNGGNRGLHPLHHVFEREHRLGIAQAIACAVAHLVRQPRAFNQRLAGHAAIVQAVAAHGAHFHQRHPGLHRRSNIGRHQTARASAYDDQVAVKAARLLGLPAGVKPALLHPAQALPRQPGETGQQHEGAQQGGAQNSLQAGEAAQLRARVHIHQRAGQHAELAHAIKGAGAHAGQTHAQVDDEKRHQGHQAQGEQVQGALACHALVELGQARAKAGLQAVAQHMARHQKSQRGPQAGGKRHHQRAPPQAKHRTTSQR